MNMAAIFFTLGLVLAISAAKPHGDRKLKQTALSILAHTELEGKEIIDRVFNDKRAASGNTTALLTEVVRFLHNTRTEVIAFRTVVLTKRGANTELPPNQGRPQGPAHFPSFPDLVLPPGLDLPDLEGLDYDQILGILGDYTKGFVLTLLPVFHQDLEEHGVLLEQLHSEVQQVLKDIDQTLSLELGDA